MTVNFDYQQIKLQGAVNQGIDKMIYLGWKVVSYYYTEFAHTKDFTVTYNVKHHSEPWEDKFVCTFDKWGMLRKVVQTSNNKTWR